MNTLDSIIPVPQSVRHDTGRLPVTAIKAFALPEKCPAVIAEVLEAFGHAVDAHWQAVPSGVTPEGAVLRLSMEPALDSEAWRCDVTPAGVFLAGGGAAGLRYALEAFFQMYLTAASDGPAAGALDMGHIEDAPRFAWRGLLLDCSRHFQRAESVRKVLRLMAHFRLNKLHWHLIDSQGFRFPSASLPRMSALAELSAGQYTREEMRIIEDDAAAMGIEIIPELDAPGHSKGLLSLYPEFACDPAAPGEELCLGNPETREMMKRLYREIVELLPRTRHIHVGGDEASTAHWEQCPRCRRAMAEAGITEPRQLEHRFMTGLMKAVQELGCTPVGWSIPTMYHQSYPNEVPQEACIQTWQDLREPIYWARRGNKVIYSLHTSLYLDYPRNFSETHEPWMFHVNDQTIYLCEPFGLWGDQVKDSLLGTEACLWTETVPEWQVIPKLLPRFPAYAECCWSQPSRKDWYDFARRKEQLEGAGYSELLRQL